LRSRLNRLTSLKDKLHISKALLGKLGEMKAAQYLKSKNYIVLETNYRCSYGELDLVALDGPELVFVEVKTRRAPSNIDFEPEEAVDRKKQRKIKECAESYSNENRKKLKRLRLRGERFDIVGVVPHRFFPFPSFRVDHFKAAFS